MAPVEVLRDGQHSTTPRVPTVRSVVGRASRLVRALLLDRRYFWHFTAILLLGELCLGVLIIWKVPYTKIDWPAYMEQVEGFLSGETDYSKLEGDTGPLVYPALHLYIYTTFHKLLPAHDRVRPAQYIFLGIYLLTFLTIATIYYLSGRRYNVPSLEPSASPSSSYSQSKARPDPGTRTRPPQALLIPLTLSKRAHSIFLLRLFNDPISLLFMYVAIIGLMLGGRKGWTIGCVLYSLALAVKMNILLFLPGLLVLLFQYRGLYGTLQGLGIVLLTQLLLPAPFFLSLTNPHLSRAYFKSAFDFSRQFLYEWTVNWRFVGESTFLSAEWARGLLIAHLSTLILFAWFKWSPVPGGTWEVLRKGLLEGPESWNRSPVTPSLLSSDHIPLVLFMSNLIGMTFARSLHYQFHSWYFHTIPFLLYSGGAWGSIPLGIALWTAIEWAWATAPSTSLSSGVLLVAHFIILGGLWLKRPRLVEYEQKVAEPHI